MWWLGALVVVVAAAMFAARRRQARRAAERRAEQAAKTARDRERRAEAWPHLAQARSAGLPLAELQEQVVLAAVLATDASSGCLCWPAAAGSFRATALLGLFPPLRPLPVAGDATEPRARMIARVLTQADVAANAAVIGRVAQSRRGERVTDPLAAGMVPHVDPALAVRSALVVPLDLGGAGCGVLAVANPTGDEAFDAADLVRLQELAELAAPALREAATRSG
jgi:hypothetical protein